MKTYECIPAFGWGIRSSRVLLINRELNRLGLTNKHPPKRRRFHELVSPYPVKVTGQDCVVEEFRQYMKRMGYDDR